MNNINIKFDIKLLYFIDFKMVEQNLSYFEKVFSFNLLLIIIYKIITFFICGCYEEFLCKNCFNNIPNDVLKILLSLSSITSLIVMSYI